MQKRAFEQTGLVPRSIIRTFDRFRRQILPGAETSVLQEFRISRYQVLVSVKCLFILLVTPLLASYFAKSIIFLPLAKYVWNMQQNEIFLNSYQEDRAFLEMQEFEEKIFFESLITDNRSKIQDDSSLFFPSPTTVATYHIRNRINSEKLFSISQAKFNKAEHRELMRSEQADLSESKNLSNRSPEHGLHSRNSAWEDKRSLRQQPLQGFEQAQNLSFMKAVQKSTNKSDYINLISLDLDDKNLLFREDYKSFQLRKPDFLNLVSPIQPSASGFLRSQPEETKKIFQNLERVPVEIKKIDNATNSYLNDVLSERLFRRSESLSFDNFANKNFDFTKQETNKANVLEKQALKNFSPKYYSVVSSFIPKSETLINQIQPDLNFRQKDDEINTRFLFQKQMQQKTIELALHYNEQSIEAVSNVFSSLITFFTIYLLFIWMKPQIIILKSFLAESLYNLSDTTKSFLLILLTDLLVGFHSPRGWEVIIEILLRNFGFPENEDFILLFVATFPVLLDTVFKYWIFRYLNQISPSTVATYHNMIE